MQTLEQFQKSESPFEDFLKELHAKGYQGTDDDMPDAFEDFVSNLSNEVLIEYSNRFSKLLFSLIK